MQNILQDIHQFNPQLSISNMLKLLERKGVILSKSMVQNYVRDGLLPPPVNKRYYTHKHLAALTLINSLKTVYEMSDIKTVLVPLMDQEGIPLDKYYGYIQKTNELNNIYETDNLLLLMLYSVDIKLKVLRRLQ